MGIEAQKVWAHHLEINWEIINTMSDKSRKNMSTFKSVDSIAEFVYHEETWKGWRRDLLPGTVKGNRKHSLASL